MNALLFAAILAVATDDLGQQIILTDDFTRACGEDRNIAYATSPNGSTSWGCWAAEGDFLHITWQFVGGRTSHQVYSLRQFERRRPLPPRRSAP